MFKTGHLIHIKEVTVIGRAEKGKKKLTLFVKSDFYRPINDIELLLCNDVKE